ncbi:MAG: hypothetical protein HY716_03410 [Planctomycetes bacterium]|nr:hypothetical protein [Planctomycetota bacterium]
MSEYQYYEFLAIDRPLTEHEMKELRSISTRAHITPTIFVKAYSAVCVPVTQDPAPCTPAQNLSIPRRICATGGEATTRRKARLMLPPHKARIGPLFVLRRAQGNETSFAMPVPDRVLCSAWKKRLPCPDQGKSGASHQIFHLPCRGESSRAIEDTGLLL